MDELKTGVDELMALLANGQRMSVNEAAKKLNVPEATVQSWVDFLVEEKILGIEYKFTTPYIYKNAPQRRYSQKEENVVQLREEFLTHANEKGIPPNKMAEMWEHHLLAAIESKAAFFEQECIKRGIKDSKLLWKRYIERLVEEYGIRHVA